MAWFYVITLWILVTCDIRVCQGRLNLFMNETETKRLLGIDGELFYVRNGVVNNYALSFNLQVKPDVNDIYFSWQNLLISKSNAMYYSINVNSSMPRAMHPPILDIAREGIVPTQLKAFRILLLCTGRMRAEVDISIQLNVTMFSVSNVTTLNIRRKKACVKTDNLLSINDPTLGRPPTGEGDKNKVVLSDGAQPDVNATYNNWSEDSSSRIDGFAGNSTNIFYIAVGCACALILLIAFIVGVYYIKSSKIPANDRISETSSSQALSHSAHTYLKGDPSHNGSMVGMRGYSDMRRPFSPSPIPEIMKPMEVRRVLGEIHIARSQITLGEILMEGTFGRVYHGTVLAEDENELDAEQEVFVKTVTDQARPDQVETMLRECCMMKAILQPNIHSILGACLEDDTQPYLVFPYTNEGNLKKFLQRCKVSEMASHCALSTQQLVYMAIQIIRGVQFLHRKRIVHKDVAARNCVVDNNLTVKISDNALSRDLFPNDYHCLGDNENRPVKWLAIEALLDRKFSAASDVWAFGVTLWELITLGQQPYAEVDPFEMASYLREGYRIAQPHNCPDELFAVMACCWAITPEERPKFSQLQICLQDFYTALGRFI